MVRVLHSLLALSLLDRYTRYSVRSLLTSVSVDQFNVKFLYYRLVTLLRRHCVTCAPEFAFVLVLYLN